MNDSPENQHPNSMDNPDNSNLTLFSESTGEDKGKPDNGGRLPERYVVKSNGNERVLICLEAPNLSVHIEVGLTITGSVARKSPGGTIFLDGVAQCEPFMDHERQVYNLDHHEGCVRAFTLSTCEQALVMYMKGLDLQNREWNIFANEPDLDTLLAIWIILNHTRIGRQETTQRRILFALVRFEGLVDALGLELKELCALPPELMRKIQRVVDHLRTAEIALKKENRWTHTDYLTYTAEILHKIDQIFYKASDFADYQGVQELARVDLFDQRIAAVVEADMGIYEIEPHLNKVYGNRLGVVFLKKGDNAYTVRQMDLFMPITLEEIYDRLNFIDPAVRCHTQSQKWGGAADIGGSPRDSGTRLKPLDIVQACREAIHKPSLLRHTYHFFSTTVLVGMIVLCAQIVRLTWHPEHWIEQLNINSFWALPDFGFIAALFLAAAISLILTAGRRAWQFGWALPVVGNWWWLLPVVLAAGPFGGVWVPVELAKSADWIKIIGLCVIGMPLATELLFRSLGHGLLAQIAAIQRCDSRWFVSWPNLASGVLYAAFALAISIKTSDPSLKNYLMTAASAGLLGLCLGFVRERSQSIWPAILFHILAAATALLVLLLF